MAISDNKKMLRALVIGAVYIAAWALLAWLVGKELLFPGPLATLKRLFLIFGQAESWAAAGMTLLRVLCGYALGVLAGVGIAVLTVRLPWAERLLLPMKSIVKATPVSSFILLAILWMTSGAVPVLMAFLMTLPLVWTNTAEAIRSTDAGLSEMLTLYGVAAAKRLKLLWLPSVLPSLLAACTTALGFAWKAGVAAEILAHPALSVGSRLYTAKLTLETADLFAWTLLVVLLSIVLEKLLVHLMRRIRHD